MADATPSPLVPLLERALAEGTPHLLDAGTLLTAAAVAAPALAPALAGASAAVCGALIAHGAFASNKAAVTAAAAAVCVGLISRDAAAGSAVLAAPPKSTKAAAAAAAVVGSPEAAAAAAASAFAAVCGGARAVKNKKLNAGCARVLTKLVRAWRPGAPRWRWMPLLRPPCRIGLTASLPPSLTPSRA